MAHPLPTLARQIPFIDHQRQHAVRSQGIVIVEILVGSAPVRTLATPQRVYGLVDTVRIAVIVVTASQSMQRTDALIDFPQQQATTVGLDGTQHARAQCTTIRLELLNRRPHPRHRAQGLVVVSEAYMYARDFAQILANIRRYPA